MKPLKNSRFALTVLMAIFAFSLSNCVVRHGSPSARAGKMPPGHAKKAAGQKSARNFAPGHNK
jgi:hypothetical protein